ncbi:MAG TPA: DUF503 domain-containing protein [Spirochaetales bacterium]|nr:DUF503 domain-containing protein [Spirochaetales bacterium]HRZ65724.1 DUF503 domain-containing protein [Spirochaetia bacterium]
MLQLIVELPESTSLKDKRRVVLAIKDRLRSKFRLSCAEVDLLDSLRFAHLGAALVSNSREHGEEVMRKALDFVESSYDLRLHDSQIHTELF